MAAAQSELPSLGKELFSYTQENNNEEVKRLLTVEKIPVDCVDADGMTPLQHAAHNGTYEMCKLLLDCGANVNFTKHATQYGALTFAAMSGNVDVVNLLLQYGAETTSVSSNNKTAAQMATFVGNHYVASIINNFIPIKEIEYCCQLQILKKEPKLPLNLTPIVHKMSIITNINPVRLALFSQNNLSILEHLDKVIRVLTIMSDKFYKQDANELMSLKFFHVAFVLQGCLNFLNNQKANDKSEGKLTNDCLNRYIKHLIKGDPKGFPIALEKFLRQGIQKYPFRESSLFHKLVVTLNSVKLGEEPSAIFFINTAVDGQRNMDQLLRCATCGDAFDNRQCASCKSVYYCDKTCQKLHFFTHKIQCRTLAEIRANARVTEVKNDCSGGSEKATFSNSDGAGCSHYE
ncbi:ankyrin repeat and MYND domain-containing protein 2 [Trichonephila clavata]|uniref:Ankyrin repeat and MYND domain-containing protein 2 n=1 Tax=Trichonephila clavata TaxID=2740835 RepID=A0A8X6FGT5_TRICU|nr:ankyrin repeat and MYND domain-containing protein 2 [Trichonephila clavata]